MVKGNSDIGESDQLSSIDIEKQYEFDPNEYDTLVRRPVMVDDPSLYSEMPPFQKPVQCPSCSRFVMRDPSVVNNKVLCPYEDCMKKFCWICLNKAKEKEACDHFSSLNMFRCYGSQYEDVRNSSVLKVACIKIFKLLTLPFVSVYSITSINF